MTSELLAQFGLYRPTDIELFDRIATTYRTVNKGDTLLREGSVCRSLYYLISGALYQSSEGDGEPAIIDLHLEHEWCINHASFVEQKPSMTTLLAYTKSTVLDLSIEQIHRLIAQSPAFLQMGRLLQQGVNRLHYFDNNLTPAQRYEYLLTNRPQLIQAFPLKMIASYLKTTPETLSRVREKIAKGSRLS